MEALQIPVTSGEIALRSMVGTGGPRVRDGLQRRENQGLLQV